MLALVALVCAAGCSFPADTAGRRYQCAAGDPCPDGTSCMQGYCEQQVPAIDGGDEVDAHAPVEVCQGGDIVRREEFGQLDAEVWFPWNNGDAEVFTTDGVLLVSSAVESNAGIIYYEDQALANLMVSVEVGRRSSGGVGSLAGLQLMDADSGETVVTIERGDDSLRAMLYPYTAEEEILAELDYDPEAHRFWRIVTTGEKASFEYSSDEIEWTELGTRTITDLPALVKPQLQSGSYGEVGQDQAFDLLTICRLPP